MYCLTRPASVDASPKQTSERQKCPAVHVSAFHTGSHVQCIMLDNQLLSLSSLWLDSKQLQMNCQDLRFTGQLTWYEPLYAHPRARWLSLLVRAVDAPAGLIVGCVVERHFLHWRQSGRHMFLLVAAEFCLSPNCFCDKQARMPTTHLSV